MLKGTQMNYQIPPLRRTVRAAAAVTINGDADMAQTGDSIADRVPRLGRGRKRGFTMGVRGVRALVGGGVAVFWLAWLGGTALASVAICVPSTAGQAVSSDGNGSAACSGAATKVALPASSADQQALISILPHIRFSTSGVGAKPTIQFSGVNVQVVSGSGTTNGTLNGEGNLVVGYAENISNRTRTGSNDLIVGLNNGWSSFGQIVGGRNNVASGLYATAVGDGNAARGIDSFVAGLGNAASGAESSVSGGTGNVAFGSQASVTGGHLNQARGASSSVVGGCENVAGPGSPSSGSCLPDAEAVLGGLDNVASGLKSTISGGQANGATGTAATVAGGSSSTASGSTSSILGGFENLATTPGASVSGGDLNTASAIAASVLGGQNNTASTNCQAIPATPGSC
jgi:hypothetical protein